jgi:two-component sensor histidine kinase/PAS domain-containing protein
VTGPAVPQSEWNPSFAEVEFCRKAFDCVASSKLITWVWPDCTRPEMGFAGIMLKALGYEAGDLASDQPTYNSLVHPEDRVLMDDAIKRIVANRRTGEFESTYRLRRKDGSYAIVRGIMAMTESAGSGTLSAFGVTWVVDSEKDRDQATLKLTHDALHAVLNQIGHAVVLLTADGRVVQANEVTARVVGRELSSLPGTTLCPFLHELDGSSVAPGLLNEVVRNGKQAERELLRFGRHWHVYLVPLPNVKHMVGRVLLLAQDVTRKKAEQQAELDRAKALTGALVREVHHRIKNHLQGLIGLLRTYSDSGLSAREVIDRAVSQILSVATVHGLLAQYGDAVIEISDLVSQIVTTLQVGSPIPLRFTVDSPSGRPMALSQQEAVPIAIAIGELCTNAIKHTHNVPGAAVHGSLSHTTDGVELNIANHPARLPEGFQLSRPRESSAGLDLVRALLPRERSTLTIEQDGDTVTTRLHFRPTSPDATGRGESFG